MPCLSLQRIAFYMGVSLTSRVSECGFATAKYTTGSITTCFMAAWISVARLSCGH